MKVKPEWNVIDTGINSAVKNMQIDQELIDLLDPQGQPILHLYEWEGDCATYGYFLDPFVFLNAEKVQQRGLNLAKRPTGGGIIFHICDFAFSALIPSSHPHYSINTLDNYALINRLVIEAFKQTIHYQDVLTIELLKEEPLPLDAHANKFCMAKPTKYDVIINGLKIGGAAQRRTKNGFLHQGSISLGMVSEAYLLDVLKPNTCVLKAMKTQSFYPLGTNYSLNELQQARNDLKHYFKQACFPNF